MGINVNPLVPEDEEEEKQSIAQKLLAMFRQGNAAFQGVLGTNLGEGESPSGRDFSRASQPRDGSPQGVFAHANRFFDDRARGRIAEDSNRREQSVAESLIALQGAQGRNLDSLAGNRPAKIDVANRKLELAGLRDDEDAHQFRLQLQFDIDEAQRTGNRADFENGILLMRALNERFEDVTNRTKVEAEIGDDAATQASRIAENEGQAAAGFGRGAEGQARALSEPTRAAGFSMQSQAALARAQFEGDRVMLAREVAIAKQEFDFATNMTSRLSAGNKVLETIRKMEENVDPGRISLFLEDLFGGPTQFERFSRALAVMQAEQGAQGIGDPSIIETNPDPTVIDPIVNTPLAISDEDIAQMLREQAIKNGNSTYQPTPEDIQAAREYLQQ